MPDVVGSDEAEAQAELEELGLEVDSRTEPSDEPTGQVTAQDPRGGTSLAEGEEVLLTVSAGPEEATVPNVIGMGRQEATTALEEAGLTVGDVTEEDSAAQTRNRVISTSPEVSETVEEGAEVDLVVASGDVTLEDYVGQDIGEVRAAVYELNLKVREEGRESSEEPGTILEQQPGAGTIRQGRTVTFVVAERPAATVTQTPSPTETDTETDEPSPTDTDTDTETETDEPSPTTTTPTTSLEPSPREPTGTRTTQSPPSP